MPSGPAGTLPTVYCEGAFRSHPVDGELDPVLHGSRLTVAWFREDLAFPVADFAAEAVRGPGWEHLAGDAGRRAAGGQGGWPRRPVTTASLLLGYAGPGAYPDQARA